MRGLVLALLLGGLAFHVSGSVAADALTPGTRVLLDAHNSYPENGRWADRIERALSTGVPIAIEQDLFWYRDPASGAARSILSHTEPRSGTEPGMREYLLERIRPIVERPCRRIAARTGRSSCLTRLEVGRARTSRRGVAAARRPETWLCTAPRGADPATVQPMRLGPVLVLTGEQDTHSRISTTACRKAPRCGCSARCTGCPRAGRGRRRTIAAGGTRPGARSSPGQPKAGEWADADQARLAAAVQAAHAAGLSIRYYTLDG